MRIARRSLALALCSGLVAVALAAPAPSAEAQGGEPTPAEVAAWVQRFYEQTTVVSARFQQHFWTKVYQRTQSSRGRVRISRPGRIRFDYDQPRGKVVASDGEGFVFYEPGDDGGAGQYVRGSSDAASSALGFLTGTARLDRDFRFSLRAASSTAPEHTQALELRPRRPDPHYVRVILYVDDRPETRGVVRRVSIEDHEGNWNRFDFSGFDFTTAIAPDVFRFTPPEGAREITRSGGEDS